MDGSDDCRGCVDGSTLDRPSICLRTGGRQRFHSDAGLHDRTLVGNDPAVACANVAFFNEIEGKTPPDACETGGPDPAHTKDELVAYLRSSGHTDWMQAAADGASERPATPEEVEALKGEW